jgi:mannose-1-phosphate guanylyltransferase
VFAKKLEHYAPSLFPYWKRLVIALKNEDSDSIKAVFDEVPSISIDYALMEKAEGVAMIEGRFGWSDVGSWSALGEIWPRDSHGNALRGENISIESEGCILHNPEKLTALIGVKDLVIVNTPDALLICRKDQDQKVKDIIQKLTQDKKDDLL